MFPAVNMRMCTYCNTYFLSLNHEFQTHEAIFLSSFYQQTVLTLVFLEAPTLCEFGGSADGVAVD